MTRSRFRPPPSRNTLLVILRDKAGPIGHVAIGSAILDADWDGALSMLPSGEHAPSLAEFFCDTPSEAARAMEELAELGDVPFHRRDFAPKWFSPRAGSAAVAWLLANRNGARARRLLTAAVCGELEHVQRVLEAARWPGYRFHFAELEPGEDARFAGPVLKNERRRTTSSRRIVIISAGTGASQLSASAGQAEDRHRRIHGSRCARPPGSEFSK